MKPFSYFTRPANIQKVKIEDEHEYKILGVKSYGLGAYKNRITKGKYLKMKVYQQAKLNHLFWCKVDTKNGAFGIITKELSDGIASSNMMFAELDLSRINPDYLQLLFRCPKINAYMDSMVTGTTNRKYIRFTDLLNNVNVPVPLLEDQNKLVEEYNKVVNIGHSRFSEGLIKSREARTYLCESIGVSELHPNGAKGEIISFELVSYKKIQEWGADKILHSRVYTSAKYETTTFNGDKSLYADIKRGKSPKYSSDSDAFVLNQKCIRWGHIELEYAKYVDNEWLQSIDKDCFTQEGDILINSTGEGTIGRAAIIDKALEGLLYDSHILLLRLNKNKVLPKYFMYVFNSRYGQEQVENVKSAKTTKQTELGIDNLKKIQFPIPPINIQEEIVSTLDAMYVEIAELQLIDQYYKKALKTFATQIFE